GCALCHTPTLTTGNAAVAALREQPVNLYSDLLVHDMGPGLGDGVSQGQAGPREFRTAPLWGLGQRLFLLHDGRTTDLKEAIRAPTGSGRPRAAFLAMIDELARQAARGELRDETQVLYVSPLKALSNDIAKNLRAPLDGIGRELAAQLLGGELPIRAAVRTGD